VHTHSLIQITDLHIGDPRIETLPVVAAALRTVEASGLPADALVFTGDLAEHGAPEEYRRLRALLDAVPTPAVFVAGNHDDRAALREHLLGADASTEPYDHAVRLGDLRIVVLDSSVPGRAYGELRSGQLAWLRAELAEPAPAGTVLALHHPPLPNASPLVAAMELQNRGALADAIAGTDVRIVLAGHTHVVSAGAIAGVPVWTGGAATYLMDALPPALGGRALRAPTISRIDLFHDGVIVTAVPLDAPVLATAPAAAVEAQVAKMQAELADRD
jgi:3',5'-cyclic AMP phosphodiesterase CpdA